MPGGPPHMQGPAWPDISQNEDTEHDSLAWDRGNLLRSLVLDYRRTNPKEVLKSLLKSSVVKNSFFDLFPVSTVALDRGGIPAKHFEEFWLDVWQCAFPSDERFRKTPDWIKQGINKEDPPIGTPSYSPAFLAFEWLGDDACRDLAYLLWSEAAWISEINFERIYGDTAEQWTSAVSEAEEYFKDDEIKEIQEEFDNNITPRIDPGIIALTKYLRSYPSHGEMIGLMISTYYHWSTLTGAELLVHQLRLTIRIAALRGVDH
jgi:hypothetical protein